jgi:hypothetical protein
VGGAGPGLIGGLGLAGVGIGLAGVGIGLAGVGIGLAGVGIGLAGARGGYPERDSASRPMGRANKTIPLGMIMAATPILALCLS